MAYDNRGYYGAGKGSYPSKPQQSKPAFQSAAPSIDPEPVPEDYVDRAEAIMKKLSENRQVVSSSKIRNLLSLVSDIYNVEKLRTEKELLPESVSKVGMMRVRTAYEAGRTERDTTTKEFVEQARLLQYLKGIGSSREALIRFAHYMEALVAYHRFYVKER